MMLPPQMNNQQKEILPDYGKRTGRGLEGAAVYDMRSLGKHLDVVSLHQSTEESSCFMAVWISIKRICEHVGHSCEGERGRKGDGEAFRSGGRVGTAAAGATMKTDKRRCLSQP
jgi:hypothetical protein